MVFSPLRYENDLLDLLENKKPPKQLTMAV